MKKVPLKDFELFKKECLKWQEKLGLHGWNLYILFEKINEDTYGQCDRDYSTHTATIIYNSELSEENFNERNVIQTARHEMFHLLLSELSALAHSRVWGDAHYYSAEEKVVNTLTKLYGNNKT
jgi:hypothetical protein